MSRGIRAEDEDSGKDAFVVSEEARIVASTAAGRENDQHGHPSEGREVNDLIEALQIMAAKVENPYHPTHCEHDELTVAVDPELFTAEEIARLDKLGFFPDEGVFKSYRFGSC